MAVGVLKARVGGSWVPVQNASSGGGSVNGPTTSLPGHVAIFNDTLGGQIADSGIIATQIVMTGDARLTDARAPLAHATTHKAGGADAIKLDELAAPSDVLTLNASAAAHGLLPKLPGNAAMYLNGTGVWVVPTATPAAHATTHAQAGSDPVDITWLAGYTGSEAQFLRGDRTWSSQLAGGLLMAGPMVFTADAVISRNTADGADNGWLMVAGGGGYGITRGACIMLGGNEYNTGLVQIFPGGINGSRVDVYRNDGSTAMLVLDGTTGNLVATSTQQTCWYFNSTHTTGGTAQIQKNGTGILNVGAANVMGLGVSQWDAVIYALQSSLYLEAAVAIKSMRIYNDTVANAANMYVAGDGQIKRSTSSLRYKTNVAPLGDDDWRWLLRVEPITFNERKDPHGRRFAGLAAEHVAAAAPMFAVFNDEGQPDEVAYGHLTAPIIRALQDQDARLRQLEGR
jgi:hypothetical protein